MFNQRLPKNAPEQYYFQLAPNYLTVRTGSIIRALKSKNNSFKLKLFKEKQLVDETKKPFSGKPINGKIPLEKAQLNFYISSHNPNRSAEYTLNLYQLEEGSETEIQVGSCTISSGIYVNEFRDHKTRRTVQNIEIGQDFTVNLDIFLNTTRYALEKFIRETREQRKQQTRNDMINNSGGYADNVPRLSQARSQKNSQSSKGGQIISGQNRFMSPSRRIVRKNANQKKLLMRSGSPVRSQKSGGSQGSKKSRDLRFLSGRDGGVSPRRERQSLAQQQVAKVDRRKEEEEKKKRILQQDARATKELEKNRAEEARKRQELNRIEETRRKKAAEERKEKEEEEKRIRNKAQEEEKKREFEKIREQSRKQKQNRAREDLEKSKQSEKKSVSSSTQFKPARMRKTTEEKEDPEDILKDTVKPQPVQAEKVDWKKDVQIKRTNSFVPGENSGFQKQNFGKKKDQMDTATIVKYVIFMIISFFLILQVMTPSRKV